MRGSWSAPCLALYGLASGCQLFGYEFDERLVHQDASIDDASIDAPITQPPELDARADVMSVREAATSDGATDATAVGGDCLPLLIGTACGVCALGTFQCEDTDLLACVGGAALPAASGTVIANWDLNDRTADGNGYSYVYSDGTSGATLKPPNGTRLAPTPSGATNTAGCAHLSGSGFSNFAGMIVKLNSSDCPFDASSKRGFAFWLKGSATADVIVSAATEQTKESQYCGDGCNDLHNVTLTLTNTWKHYTFQWSDLHQSGWGTPITFDATQLRYLQFSFGPRVTFDLYVDELNFY